MTGYEIGYIVGRLLCLGLVFIFSLLVIGVVQYARTHDRNQALRTALSWWALALGLFLAGCCCVLSSLGQFTQQFEP